jgi:hypothetical protein
MMPLPVCSQDSLLLWAAESQVAIWEGEPMGEPNLFPRLADLPMSLAQRKPCPPFD